MIAEYARSLSIRKSPGTVKQRVRHITELLAVHPDPRAITLQDLENELAKRHMQAEETLRSRRSSYAVFFAWAHRRGYIDSNPAADLEPIVVHVRVPRLAPDDDVQKALTRATLHEQAMILLARMACLRLTELTMLHTRDRFGDYLIVLGKGNKERRVYLNEQLTAALNQLEHEQGDGYYFRGQRGPHMHPQSVNKIITRLTGYNPHALRHAGATAAYNATRDLRGVQEMLGHASMATTQRYLHVNSDSLRAVAAATAFRQPEPTPPANAIAPRPIVRLDLSDGPRAA